MIGILARVASNWLCGHFDYIYYTYGHWKAMLQGDVNS